MSINYSIVDSNDGPRLFEKDNVVCLNLCSYFKKKNDFKIFEADKSQIEHSQELNLCNFASLCYKLNILYISQESHNLLRKIIELIKNCNPSISLVQKGIDNYMEVDCKPIHNLIKRDQELQIHKIFKNQCNYLGFTDSQIINLCNKYNNIEHIIPKDIMERVPLESDLSNMTYRYLLEIMNA